MSNSSFPELTLSITSEIVSSYVSNHTVQAEDLDGLIKSVYASVHSLQGASRSILNSNLSPAVPVEESVHDDYIICLEDGKRLQMLKRHLRSSYGMSVEEYREKWGLPADYPSVAPGYAKRRSSIAKQTGLGLGNSRRKADLNVVVDRNQKSGILKAAVTA